MNPNSELKPQVEEVEGVSEMMIDCPCGCSYSLHMHTVCPRCFAWPRKEAKS